MTFNLIKKLGGTRYESLGPTERSAQPSPTESSSPARQSPTVDMISFSDDDEKASPDKRKSTDAKHERTLSDESVTSHWDAVLAPKKLRPRRPAPPVPETMEVHLKRLSPNAVAHRDTLAKGILARAAEEWKLTHPTPVTLERMSVQSFEKVNLQEDVAGRNAFICSAGLSSPQETAKHFWSVARDSVLEVYIVPRPPVSEPGRSAYHPQALARIADENPALGGWLDRIEATDFSSHVGNAVVYELAALSPRARVWA